MLRKGEETVRSEKLAIGTGPLRSVVGSNCRSSISPCLLVGTFGPACRRAADQGSGIPSFVGWRTQVGPDRAAQTDYHRDSILQMGIRDRVLGKLPNYEISAGDLEIGTVIHYQHVIGQDTPFIEEVIKPVVPPWIKKYDQPTGAIGKVLSQDLALPCGQGTLGRGGDNEIGVFWNLILFAEIEYLEFEASHFQFVSKLGKTSPGIDIVDLHLAVSDEKIDSVRRVVRHFNDGGGKGLFAPKGGWPSLIQLQDIGGKDRPFLVPADNKSLVGPFDSVVPGNRLRFSKFTKDIDKLDFDFLGFSVASRVLVLLEQITDISVEQGCVRVLGIGRYGDDDSDRGFNIGNVGNRFGREGIKAIASEIGSGIVPEGEVVETADERYPKEDLEDSIGSVEPV